MPIQKTESEKWEAVLERDGLSPIPDQTKYMGVVRLLADPEAIEDFHEPTPWTSASDHETVWMGEAVIGWLSKRHRLVLWLARDGYSQWQIAERVGLKQLTVAYHYARAIGAAKMVYGHVLTGLPSKQHALDLLRWELANAGYDRADIGVATIDVITMYIDTWTASMTGIPQQTAHQRLSKWAHRWRCQPQERWAGIESHRQPDP